MTHLSDELLSAHIDGDDLWSPDATHLDECEECRHRLDGLRGAVAALAAPVTAPAPHVREAAVAAAMTETSGAIPTLRRLTSARRAGAGKPGTPRRMSALSAAAALVVALGVGGWLLSQTGVDRADDTQSSGALSLESKAATPTGGAGSAAESFAADDASGGSIGGILDAGDIGVHADIASVADVYRDPDRVSTTAMSHEPCPPLPNHVTMWHASLTYNGEPAWARVVQPTESSAQTLQVLRQASCELVASQAL